MALRLLRNKEPNDEQLIEAFQSTGDLDILGRLYQRYMHLVYGVCLKYLKNREDAQDAVMAIFEKLSRELMDKEVDVFKPWLYVVSKNYCLMQLRHQKSVQQKEKEFQNTEILFMENPSMAHLTDEWEPEAMDDRLQECLKKLRLQQRQCIELFYFEELCYQDISQQLKLDLKKVKSYIQNGKRNLKICLESNHAS
ncbi:MAG: sigma-70 family RNA polymerase sigma factor [Marinilabiliaceae bacterium]|nr:sigma-70 family RNA polymerase sigma factor [Marinilabiliaceae bacterium]